MYNNNITGNQWSNNIPLCLNCPSNDHDSCQFYPSYTSTKTVVVLEFVVGFVDNVDERYVVVVGTMIVKHTVDLVRVHRRLRRRHRPRYCTCYRCHFQYCCSRNCYCD